MQCLSQSNATLQGDISKYLVLATGLFFSPLVIEAFSLFCKQQQQEKGFCKASEGASSGSAVFLSDIKALKDHLRNAGLLHDHYGRDLVQVGTCMGMRNFGKHTTLSNVSHFVLSAIVRILNILPCQSDICIDFGLESMHVADLVAQHLALLATTLYAVLGLNVHKSVQHKQITPHLVFCEFI